LSTAPIVRFYAKDILPLAAVIPCLHPFIVKRRFAEVSANEHRKLV
jgi:hypothetical protein